MREKILVVDDEPMIGRGISRLLHRDHDVEWVGSVDEALAALQRNAGYSLVVSDLLMPDRTGMDLFEEMRQRWPALADRMLFLTGGASNDESRDFISLLGEKIIMKPFSGDDLRRAVSSAVRKADVHAEL